MAVAETLYPSRCAGCGQRGHWLCAECDAALPQWTPPWCSRCGVPGGCDCADVPPALDTLRAVAPFDGWLRRAIIAFKYHGEWARADHLGAALAGVIDATSVVDGVGGVDALVPVPLHPRRERHRGYNQADLLAQRAGTTLGLPVMTALRRVRDTPRQVGADAATRHANVAAAFATVGDIRGGRFLLVDDVFTTGATIGACASALREAGAVGIGAVVLARQMDDW